MLAKVFHFEDVLSVYLRLTPIVVFILAFGMGKSQCPDQPINLLSQDQVDIFVSNFSNCNVIGTHLFIGDPTFPSSGSDIIDLSGLVFIDSVQGDLIIENNNQLSTLQGLDNLKYVRGNLEITENRLKLKNMVGLGNLVSIGGSLIVKSNSHELESLQGLDSLQFIGGDLIFEDHTFSLQSLSGLENLSTIMGTLRLKSNPNLKDVKALSNLMSIGESLIIDDCGDLVDLNGMNKIATIGLNLSIRGNFELESIEEINDVRMDSGSFSIVNNPRLLSIPDFPGVTRISESFVFQSNDMVKSIDGFNNLTSIGKTLIVENNDSLLSVKGFQNLNYVGRSFTFRNNERLRSLNGFNELDSVGFEIRIQENESMTDFSEFDALVSVPDIGIFENRNLVGILALDKHISVNKLSIASNPKLNNCAVQTVCEYYEFDYNGNFFFNDSCCYTRDIILVKCNSTHHSEIQKMSIDIHPNPISDRFTFRFNGAQGDLVVQLYDTFGRVIMSGIFDSSRRQIFIDPAVVSGVYYLMVYEQARQISLSKRIVID